MLLHQNRQQTGHLIAALHGSGIETTLLTTAPPDGLGASLLCVQLQTPSHSSAEYVPLPHAQVARTNPDPLNPLSEALSVRCTG